MEKQVLSVRVNNDSLTKFKEYLKGFNGPADFMDTLLDTYSLSEKKNNIPEYQTSIQAIEIHFNEIIKILVGVLASKEEITHSLKLDAQKEVEKELQEKNLKIDELTEQLQKLQKRLDEQEHKADDYKSQLQKKTVEADVLNSDYQNLKQQFDMFQSIINDYKDYKLRYENIIAESSKKDSYIESLKKELDEQKQLIQLKQQRLDETQDIIIKFFKGKDNQNKSEPIKNKKEVQTAPTVQTDINLPKGTKEEQKEYLQQFTKDELINLCKKVNIKTDKRMGVEKIINIIIKELQEQRNNQYTSNTESTEQQEAIALPNLSTDTKEVEPKETE